jgi:hypothetical protein
VELAELPAPVQAAINAQVGKGKLEGVDKTTGEDGVDYEATLTTPAGQEHDFTVSSAGVLLDQEVTLGETSPAVQGVITQTIGNGKILYIDQSFNGAHHSYEVEGQKNGKDIKFRVGSRGRLIGTIK